MGSASAQFGQYLLRRPESEIVQHDNNIPRVASIFFNGHHRCRQKLLLTQAMGMHPMGAGRQREIMGVGLADGQRTAIGTGAILNGGRFDLSVPMHLQRLTRGIEKIARKAFTLTCDHASLAI